jgi:putative FmdB family regulatory protein
MPIYDYECANCRRQFEVVHGVHVPGPTSCPLCGGGPVRKSISAPAVHFKGTGWAKKERRPAAPASKKESGDGATGAVESTDGSGPAKPATRTATETSGTAPSGGNAKPADHGGD